MDNILELDSDILATVTRPETAKDWLTQLKEAITEGLLTEAQVDSLMLDPMDFLISYTSEIELATEIYQTIVKGYFISSLQSQEKAKDRRHVINEASLNALDSALSFGNISAVDLSIIYKNTKKE